jgi:hypothetical protein
MAGRKIDTRRGFTPVERTQLAAVGAGHTVAAVAVKWRLAAESD